MLPETFCTRTFLNGFDIEGNRFKFGNYGMNAIQRKLLRADTIQSILNQKTNGNKFNYNYKRRQNMKKAIKRVFLRPRIKKEMRIIR
jgi:hypothetical protein